MYPIPANATRIRYLESTGTQYIDTGIYYATPIEFQADVSVTQINGSNCVFGCSTVTNRFCLGISQTGNVDLGMGAGVASPSLAQSIVLGQRYLFRYQLASRRTIWQDGTSLWTGDLQPAPSNVSIWAFGSRRGPSESEAYMRSGDGWKGRIYALKIMQGSGYPPVRDFIPVRVGTVGYLFDRVSGTLFGNAGTGDFVLGPDIDYEGAVPCSMVKIGAHEQLPYDEQIEYIESTGDQYTTVRGIGPITRIEAEFKFTDVAIKQGRIVSTFDAGQSLSNNGIGEIYCNGNGVVSSSWNQDWLASGYNATASAYVFDLNGVTKKTIWKRLSDGATTTKSHSSVGAFRSDLYVLHGYSSLSTNQNATCKARLMWCKAYSYDNLVTDLVPVRIGTVGALYDKVGGKCFYNEGTGSFLLGA